MVLVTGHICRFTQIRHVKKTKQITEMNKSKAYDIRL